VEERDPGGRPGGTEVHATCSSLLPVAVTATRLLPLYLSCTSPSNSHLLLILIVSTACLNSEASQFTTVVSSEP